MSKDSGSGERSSGVATRGVAGIYAGLSVFSVGVVALATGLSGLFARQWAWAPWAAGGGAALAVAGGVVGLFYAGRLPPPRTESEHFGRYMVGLSFALLVVGIANAAGISTLAITGELEASAASLDALFARTDRGSEDGIVARCGAATERLAQARIDRHKLEGEQRASERTAGQHCAGPTGSADSGACLDAQVELAATQAAAAGAGDTVELSRIEQESLCARAEAALRDKNRALFFLLSLSTVMAVFGALFFVVNKLRTKRNRAAAHEQHAEAESSPEPQTGTSSEPAKPNDSASSRPSTPPETEEDDPAEPATPASSEPEVAGDTVEGGLPPAERYEPFDVYRFWGGSFFRAGEAVLFTFTFYFVIWTYAAANLTWLPVAALFVGMFVKSGEAVVFGLGLRVLAAVEALLPVGNGPSDLKRPARTKRGSGKSS